MTCGHYTVNSKKNKQQQQKKEEPLFFQDSKTSIQSSKEVAHIMDKHTEVTISIFTAALSTY